LTKKGFWFRLEIAGKARPRMLKNGRLDVLIATGEGKEAHPSMGSSLKLDDRVVTGLKYCFATATFATVTVGWD
jgi:hypothetical protein